MTTIKFKFATSLVIALILCIQVSAQNYNGLTKVGNNFELGGTLTKDTKIDLGVSFFFKLSKSTQNYLTVINNGNVGIGTAAPSAQLHTTGSVQFNSLAGAGSRMVIADANGLLSTQSIPAGGNNITGPVANGMLISDGTSTGLSAISGVKYVNGVLEIVNNDNNYARLIKLRNTNSGTASFSGVSFHKFDDLEMGQVAYYNPAYGDASLAGNFGLFTKFDAPIKLQTSFNNAATPPIQFQIGANMKMEITNTQYKLNGLNDNTGIAKMMTVNNGVVGFQNIPTGGSPEASYIENQTVSSQTAGFNINGNGFIGGRMALNATSFIGNEKLRINNGNQNYPALRIDDGFIELYDAVSGGSAGRLNFDRLTLGNTNASQQTNIFNGNGSLYFHSPGIMYWKDNTGTLDKAAFDPIYGNFNAAGQLTAIGGGIQLGRNDGLINFSMFGNPGGDAAYRKRVAIFSGTDIDYALYVGNSTNTASYFNISNSGVSSFGSVMQLHNNAVDPASANAGMYYNSATNKFRGYQNGAWKNFLMEGDVASGGTLSLPANQVAYGSTGNTITSNPNLTFDGMQLSVNANARFQSGTMGNMGFPYENIIVERNGNNALGIYSSGTYANDAALVLGNTSTPMSNTNYPGFQINHMAGATPAENSMRFAWLERNAAGTIVAHKDNIINIKGDASVFMRSLNDNTAVPKMVTSTNGVLGYQVIPNGGGIVSIPSTQVAYGSTENTVTSNSNLTFDGTNFLVNGNIGIGTATTNAYKLAVNGSAIFTKVKVRAYDATWPDYVFDPNYNLPSLKQVEEFIKQHKRLPEVPSAAEVKKEGLDIGDNEAMLLKKIEELTLYAISQQKEIESLKSEMQSLKNLIRNK